MGFSFMIGEFFCETTPESRTCRESVRPVRHESAPNVSDKRNVVHGSYTGWSEFLDSTGLGPPFRGDADGMLWTEGQCRALLAYHPSAEPLRHAHAVAFERAAEQWQGDPDTQRVLDWLVYWTDWALEECEYPTFCNW